MALKPQAPGTLTWVYISAAGFILSFAAAVSIMLGIGRATIPNGLYFLILIPLGVAAAAFLFGAMRSYAKFKGQTPQGTLELGGPVVVLALVVIGGYYFNRPSTFSLTIRVHGPGGPADVVRTGRLTVYLAGVQRGDEIGTDGEVVLGDVPADLDGTAVRLIPEVPGYELADAAPSVIPESHIIELGLKRRDFATPMRGTVRNRQGLLVSGATINFDGGSVTVRSDGDGNFAATLPKAPGTVISVLVTVAGKVVYNDNVTVAESPPLQIVVPEAEP